MHPKNPYATKKPDFGDLAKKYPAFADYVRTGEDGYSSIDFQDPSALRELTKVLLKEDWNYDVELREDRLCPTLANRLDYILFLLDLAPHIQPNGGESSPKLPLRFLDIGTGAVAIYPLLLYRLDPTCKVVATGAPRADTPPEIDETSLVHVRKTLADNDISPNCISIVSPTGDRILDPLYSGPSQANAPASSTHDEINDTTKPQFDFSLCNPPFFASEEEMQEGKDLKEERPHAAPTAAFNELVTPGGEVSFVSKMIEESIDLGERCTWYTSLIGKYSSLQNLVRVLERHQIDNYFIKSIKQAKTARWILGWSHTAIRLPDSLTRPPHLIAGTSFARILPPPNTFTHELPSTDASRTLTTKVIEILQGIQLLPADYTPPDKDAHVEVIIAPTKNTWSRAARRQAARGEATEKSETALFSARISIEADTSTSASANDGEKKEEEGCASSLKMDWLDGKDRTLVEALWKYVLSKTGLTNQSNQPQGQKRDREEEAGGREQKREYPEGHWRGGPPGVRGFGSGRPRGRGGMDDRGRGRGRRGIGFGRPDGSAGPKDAA